MKPASAMSRSMCTAVCGALGVTASVWAATPPAITCIAQTGDLAPGQYEEPFEHFFPPTINRNGVVGVSALVWLQSYLAAPQSAVFTWQDGEMKRIAEFGDPLWEGSPYVYVSFDSPIVGDRGELAMSAWYGSCCQQRAVVAGWPDHLELVAMGPADIPPPSAIQDDGVSLPRLTPNGTLGLVTGLFTHSTLWLGWPPRLEAIVSGPVAAPGFPGSTVSPSFEPHIDAAGNVIGMTTLQGGSLDDERVLQRANTAGSRLVVAPGHEAPVVEGAFIGAGPHPSCNAAGVMGFTAPYQLGPGTTVHHGAWIGKPGRLRLIAHSNQRAPGLFPPFVFGPLYFPLTVTSSGHALLIIRAFNQGQSLFRDGMWLHQGDELILLMASGDSVANAPPGTTLYPFATSAASPTPAINSNDDTVMIVPLAVPEAGIQKALITVSPERKVRALAIESLPFEVAPGDVRIVDEVGAAHLGEFARPGANGEDGTPSPLNDMGELVFVLRFQDNTSGIFLANLN